jgi:hypothetical protein
VMAHAAASTETIKSTLGVKLVSKDAVEATEPPAGILTRHNLASVGWLSGIDGQTKPLFELARYQNRTNLKALTSIPNVGIKVRICRTRQNQKKTPAIILKR